jgi:hypothetical protein
MKYLTFIRHPESYRQSPPPSELMEAMGKFVSTVMRAVYRESTELPPLRFPWVPIRHRRSRLRVDDRVRGRSVVPC